MKRTLLAVAAGLTCLVVNAMAQTTNTLTVTNAIWNDGGTLNGSFTVVFDASGKPIGVTMINISTSAGDNLPRFDYYYHVADQVDTVSGANIYATQSDGHPANEILVEAQDQIFQALFLNLDWQGVTPTSLYVGDPGAMHTSEIVYTNVPPDGPMPVTRELTSGGVITNSVPEPSSYALFGLSTIGLLMLFRPKKPKQLQNPPPDRAKARDTTSFHQP
ncbi:MAG: PEP-CTERM sorting domain-containing protein [bacterium]